MEHLKEITQIRKWNIIFGWIFGWRDYYYCLILNTLLLYLKKLCFRLVQGIFHGCRYFELRQPCHFHHKITSPWLLPCYVNCIFALWQLAPTYISFWFLFLRMCSPYCNKVNGISQKSIRYQFIEIFKDLSLRLMRREGTISIELIFAWKQERCL